MSKIIALDTHVTDFDGLEFSGFSDIGEFKRFEFTSANERIERIGSAEAILTNKVIVDQELLKACPNLKYVGVTATGVNNIDLEAAKQHGVTVTNVPGYSTDSVAQLVFSYILKRYTAIEENSSTELLKEYQQSKFFSLQKIPTRELKGKSLAIIGYGEIGQQVAKIGEAFGLKILKAALPGRCYPDQRTSLDDIFYSADIISLHCPLTSETEGLVGASNLAKMKSASILINTARGPLIDEGALASALNKKQIAHAYLDVLSVEPPAPDNPLLSCKNVTITPHLAWATREARERLVDEAFKNLTAWKKGERRNVVV
jgi:glycerate dehydrogenase